LFKGSGELGNLTLGEQERKELSGMCSTDKFTFSSAANAASEVSRSI